MTPLRRSRDPGPHASRCDAPVTALGSHPARPTSAVPDDAVGTWSAWEGEGMIRIRVGRSAPELDDEERVARFIWSLLLAGVVLVAAGVSYLGWYLVRTA